MPDLTFQIRLRQRGPTSPRSRMLAFQLQIKNSLSGEAIHTIALRCQIQIEATRRRYTPSEQEQMLDLFGQPDRWSQTLRSLLWTHVNLVVPAFAGTRPSSTCRYPAPSISTSPQRNTSPASRRAISRCCCSSAEQSSTPPPDSPLQVAPISWEQGSPIQASRENLARLDGHLLPRTPCGSTCTRCLRAPLSLQDAAWNPDLGAGARALASAEEVEVHS